MDVENPWDEKQEPDMDEKQKGEAERPPSIEDFPQPELQIVPPTQKPESPPPITSEDVDHFEKERRRKIWQPPIAEA